MDYQNITLEVQDRICSITVNRPPVNAINGKTYQELTDAFTVIIFRDDISVVIFKGAGRGFVAGNDINDIKLMTKENHHAYQDVLCGCAISIMKCKYPVIGAIHKFALGAGLVFAAACDIVIASEGTKFGLPEVTLSIVSGSSFLSLMAPDKIVRYMALSGKPLTAEELFRLGGINKVTREEDLFDEALMLAKEMVRNSPIAMQFSKEAMNINRNAQIEKKFLTETLYTDRLLGSPEKAECTNAFFEKRKPNFGF